MDSNIFDIFSATRNFLFMGNYNDALIENESTDISEYDITQIIRKKFYLYLTLVEENKTEELKNLIQDLKKAEGSIKIYFNIFKIHLQFYLNNTYKEDLLLNYYKQLIELNDVSAFLQPAIYLVSSILLDIDDRERFLHLTGLMDTDPEIMMLRFYYFLKMNKLKEVKALLEILNQKDPDSNNTILANLILDLIEGKNEKLFKTVQEIKQNNKISAKLYNIISVVMMNNGNFKEAVKPLTVGLESLKNSEMTSDFTPFYVNLICCYRNLGMDSELKDAEDKLRSYSPNNPYFIKIKEFEDEFEKIN